MTKRNIKILEREIEECKVQLKKMEPMLYENAGVAENYNRLLVKKAILTDKYKKIINEKPLITRLFSGLKFRKGPKLICDFFPNA